MTDQKGVRLSKLAKELNVGLTTIVDSLKKKGITVELNPNAKISPEAVLILEKEFSSEINAKKESEKLNLQGLREKRETITIQDVEKIQNEDIDEDDEVSLKDIRMKSILEEKKKETEAKTTVKISIELPKKETKQEVEIPVEKTNKEVIESIE